MGVSLRGPRERPAPLLRQAPAGGARGREPSAPGVQALRLWPPCILWQSRLQRQSPYLLRHAQAPGRRRSDAPALRCPQLLQSADFRVADGWRAAVVQRPPRAGGARRPHASHLRARAVRCGRCLWRPRRPRCDSLQQPQEVLHASASLLLCVSPSLPPSLPPSL